MKRLRILTALSATAVLAALLTPATASASAPAHGRLLATVRPSAAPPAASRLAAPLHVRTAESARNCTPTPAGSPERRAGGVLLCMSPKTPGESVAGTVSPMDSGLCSTTQLGYITANRFGSCSKQQFEGDLLDTNGKLLGTYTLTVINNVTLSATSATPRDDITVTLVRASGEVGSVAVGITASCTSACRTTNAKPWAGNRVLSVGQSLSGAVTFSETLAKGAQDSMMLKYDIFSTVPGGVPVQPNNSWDGVYTIRCDNAVGNNSGCVYSATRASFGLSLNTYQAAAVTYYFAQEYLPDGWGLISPLHRLADERAASANRSRTCDSTFVAVSYVANDSCDEFPFAATYEGGGAGSQCADIAALYEDGGWNIYQANPTKPITMTEHCVRGHVPLSQNTGAGGELGRFVQAQRVLDFDSYLLYFF